MTRDEEPGSLSLNQHVIAPPTRLDFKSVWESPFAQIPKRFDRVVTKLIAGISVRYVIDITGEKDNLLPKNDPFVVVLNHNQRFEAVQVPSLLIFYRNGKPVHFMADWNFMMVPLVATLYRVGQTIIVSNKSAKPKFLNVFKPLFREEIPAFDRAVAKLRAGSSIGVFPEGTINRDPNRLMRGLPGAAKMSLLSGAPILPVGIRFPELEPDAPIPDGAKMLLEIGNPIEPPPLDCPEKPSQALVQEHHGQMMTELAKLSGKTWRPNASKRRKYVSK